MILQRLVNIELGTTRLDDHSVGIFRGWRESKIIIGVTCVHVALNHALELGALVRLQLRSNRCVCLRAPKVILVVISVRCHPIRRTLRVLFIVSIIDDVEADIGGIASLTNVHALGDRGAPKGTVGA